ncbi:MAG: mechanosensitive ion channel family protein [Lentisphaerae bacterium]|nr:mechanosensitive ion channel family protein [Lentisphaerota bacterium]
MTFDSLPGSWSRGLVGILSPTEVLTRVLGLLLVYAAFILLQRALRRFALLRSVSVQLNLLMLSLLLMLFLSPVLEQMHHHVLAGVLAAATFLGLAIALKLFDVVAFDAVARWRQTTPVPLVVRDIGRWLLNVAALVLVIRGYFPGVNLNVLAVSSLVVGYVVGNATQDTLGNLFAGLALNAERPFHIGDWVTVGGHTGRVVDTTWRATRLHTKAEDHIVIPNSSIAKEPILNFSRPTRCHGCYATIGVSYETPPNLAREAIQSVLRAIPEVLEQPAPSIYLSAYADSAITFTIKYFIADYARLDPVQSLVMDRLWYAFKRAGVGIPFPIRDVRMRDATADDARLASAAQTSIRQLLGRVDLLGTLKPEDLARLAGDVQSVPYALGETLFRQGDAGDTFCLVSSGRVAVIVRGADGRDVPVAELGPGSFFGEMSLLTGEPRSATIRAEVDTVVLVVAKSAFAELLQGDPGLAVRLAAVLEKRQADSQAKLAASPAGAVAPAVTREPVLNRIRRFFSMA